MSHSVSRVPASLAHRAQRALRTRNGGDLPGVRTEYAARAESPRRGRAGGAQSQEAATTPAGRAAAAEAAQILDDGYNEGIERAAVGWHEHPRPDGQPSST
jgi:hypothetical protein